jgi:hypothetical protein
VNHPLSWSEFFSARLPHIYLVYGEAEIDSGMGRGTRLVVSVPLANTGGMEDATHQADAS